MLRITPDVNMLVEGTISRNGPAGAILAAWEAVSVELVICDEIIAEYEDVLGRPRIQRRYRHITSSAIAAASATLRRYSRLIHVHAAPAVVSQDPDDDIVLACAVAGGVDYIVSRDRHLSEIGSHQGIAIVRPEQFASILRSTTRSV